jgi:hypothetical protein
MIRKRDRWAASPARWLDAIGQRIGAVHDDRAGGAIARG